MCVDNTETEENVGTEVDAFLGVVDDVQMKEDVESVVDIEIGSKAPEVLDKKS